MFNFLHYKQQAVLFLDFHDLKALMGNLLQWSHAGKICAVCGLAFTKKNVATTEIAPNSVQSGSFGINDAFRECK